MNSFNKAIENTCLSFGSIRVEIEKLCSDCNQYAFRAAVVNPNWLQQAHGMLNDGIKLVTVIGFPFGAVSTKIKLLEIETALEHGANEFDIVMNLSLAREGSWEAVEKELCEACKLARPYHVKVIIECSVLDDNQIVTACKVLENAGVWAVKTNTGMGPRGATVENVDLIKSTIGKQMIIKAAGGIKTYKFAKELMEAGADLIGTSSGAVILNEMTKCE